MFSSVDLTYVFHQEKLGALKGDPTMTWSNKFSAPRFTASPEMEEAWI